MSIRHVDAISTLETIADDAIIQLVYVSSLSLKGRLSVSIFDEIEAQASLNNQQKGITGVLCYGNGQFLQCIEGKKASIVALTTRIFSDKRHKNAEVLLLSVIEQRRFVDWRMRLLFLERWLWSPATKQQAAQLSPFLPFSPHGWAPERTERFLDVIQSFDSPPHMRVAGITYNALGNMLQHIAAPHQAFLVVQGLLTLLVIVALMLLYV